MNSISPVSLFQLRWFEVDHLVAPQFEESHSLLDPADDPGRGRDPAAIVGVPYSNFGIYFRGVKYRIVSEKLTILS